MRRSLCAFTMVAVSLFATPALADPRATSPEEAAREASLSPPPASNEALPPPLTDTQQRQWYGWQTLIVDGVGVLTLPVFVGVGVYLIGPPIVHWAHGRVGLGFADMGMRLGLALALTTAEFAARGPEHLSLLTFALVFSVIESPAIALDASVLAWEKVERPKVTPFVVPRKEGGAVLGVGGAF